MSKMEAVSKELLQTLWELEPVGATSMGIKGFESKLSPVDLDQRSNLLKRLVGFSDRLKDLMEKGELSASERLDAEVAIANIRVRTAEDTANQDLKINPTRYISQVNGGLHGLISREWDSKEDRIEGLRSRLQQIPNFVATARRNLIPSEIPPEWLEIAIGSAQGHQRVIDGSVRPFAKSVIGEESAFEKLCDGSVAAVSEFCQYLKEIQPVAKGQFASGRAHFERMLHNIHMIDMDTDQLKEFGESKVAEYEAALDKAAKAVDPYKHWTQQIDEFKDDHPTPETLLDSYRNEGRLAEAFVREKDLISIPACQKWTVVPVAEYSRATTPLGHMRTSPPFVEGCESALCITPIDPLASPERQKQHLRDNCYAFQRTIAFHELIPGHHLQACLAKMGSSGLRKQFHSSVFTEGWGLYTEVLMAEQGYLDEAATTLINLKNALWRAVRVVVDVGLHVSGMTLAEATRMLQQKVRMEHHMASGEAKRYTMSPTYQSSYLLGKEQIVGLRKEYQQKLGSQFTLKKFHDKLTSYGSIPVALVRREMLAGR